MKRLFVVLSAVVLLFASCADSAVTDSSSQNSNENINSIDTSSQESSQSESNTDVSSQEPSQSVSSTDASSQDFIENTIVPPDMETILSYAGYYNGLNDKFVKTNSKTAIEEIKIAIIKSVDELQKYYDDNKDLYDLEEFKIAISEFDDEYFEEKAVILAPFASGESCIGHAVYGIHENDGNLDIIIADVRKVLEIPKREPKDFWHGIIKLDKAQLPVGSINVKSIPARSEIDASHSFYITEIYEDFFVGEYAGDRYVVYGEIAHDYCVGDGVTVTFENAHYCSLRDTELYDEGLFFIHWYSALGVEPANFKPDVATGKPVIYIYPTEKTDVTVKLDFNGRLGYTYPEYDGLWKVTAYPDGKLVDEEGRKYNTLFWDGWSDVRYDLSKGFCVKGEDTEDFLKEKLAFLGLNEKESKEFLEYWLKWMEGNNYNVITFQDELYKETAKLTILPEPDAIIRVFMAFAPSDEFIELEPQILIPAKRYGYTVVEWGGTMQ